MTKWSSSARFEMCSSGAACVNRWHINWCQDGRWLNISRVCGHTGTLESATRRTCSNKQYNGRCAFYPWLEFPFACCTFHSVFGGWLLLWLQPDGVHAWVDVRAVCPLEAVGLVEDLQALRRSPEKVATQTWRSGLGQEGFPHGQSVRLTSWNRSPSFDGYQDHPALLALRRRAGQNCGSGKKRQSYCLRPVRQTDRASSRRLLRKKNVELVGKEFSNDELERRRNLQEQTQEKSSKHSVTQERRHMLRS